MRLGQRRRQQHHIPESKAGRERGKTIEGGKLDPAIDRVDAQLAKSSFLVGDSYSLADLAWTSIFARLRMLGLDDSFWNGELRPRIGAYYERLRARTSFDRAGMWEGRPAPDARRAMLKAMLVGSSEIQVEA